MTTPSKQIPEPWASFLSQVDNHLHENVELHCLGGFVVTMLYSLARSTTDRDDVKYLARTIPFDLDALKDRYRKELRPLLGNPDREDLTLRLRVEPIEEDRG